jgi:hypothetical protein
MTILEQGGLPCPRAGGVGAAPLLRICDLLILFWCLSEFKKRVVTPLNVVDLPGKVFFPATLNRGTTKRKGAQVSECLCDHHDIWPDN